MAIGWMSVLKMVPWGDVIENAPAVAAGAKKLWSSVAKKPAVDVVEPVPEGAAALTPQALQAQLAHTQQALAELQQELRASTEVIESLAQQNTQLIARVELSRRRLLALAVGTGLLAVGLVALAVVVLRD